MAVYNLIFLILFLGDFVWCWKMHRRLSRFPWPVAWKIGLFTFTTVQVFGLVVLFFGRRLDLPLETSLGKPLVAGIYIWHCLVLLPLALLWLVTKAVTGPLWIGRVLTGRERSKAVLPSESREDRTMTRRDFVSAAVCAAPAVVALGATGLAAQEWNQFRVRHMVVLIPGLPSALDGLTIAQVCDLHVGVFTHGAILEQIVEATNHLQADLVLLPGDLINYSLTDLSTALGVVQRLRGKHGVFVCEGNHDLFENATEFRERTIAAGVRLLVNDTADLSVNGAAIQILGLRWGAAQGDPRALSSRGDAAIAGSMKELLLLRRPDAFPILLAHHPHAFDFASDIPLTLSGHTHGGQMMLTKEIGFGPAMFRYWSGRYEKAGRTLVVSNGVGNWFPLRVQAPAEIVHLTLRPV